MPVLKRRSGADACPGALDVHRAADGGLARVRIPGGRITSAQLSAVAEAAVELGGGVLEPTSRANLQVRGLEVGGEVDLAARLVAAGLLPSVSHEKVRNIISSPLGGPGRTAELDAALCADPVLAGLPGRFLFALDDGRGDVAWLGADVAALPVGDEVAVLLGGADHGVRVAPGEVVSTLLAAARAFLELREGHWRIAELGGERIAERLRTGGVASRAGRLPRGGPVPVGRVRLADGTPAVGALAPPGGLGARQVAELARADHVVITPWRGVVVPGGDPGRLAAAGMVVDPASPAVGVTSCVGRPGCAKSLADVRADAARIGAAGRPVHLSGCGRRCGRPSGDVVDVVATAAGYEVDGRAVPGDRAVAAITASRRHRVTDYVRDGAEIYRRSFATIRAEADLAAFPPDVARAVVRMIHACGMVDLVADVAFSPDVVARARAALDAGAPVLCDARMVASGITRARLPKDNEVVCSLSDPSVPALAAELGTTRSAAALELWRDRLAGSVVAIGNAPTALFRLLEMIDEGVGAPAAVLGLPVGFIGAAESKDALAEHGGVPYLVVRGRRGGSALAAAAVNAIASDVE